MDMHDVGTLATRLSERNIAITGVMPLPAVTNNNCRRRIR